MSSAEYQLPYGGAKEMLLVEDIENRFFLKEYKVVETTKGKAKKLMNDMAKQAGKSSAIN